jgi:hypothetical protein
VGSPDDHAAVEAVARDYFEGWFAGDAQRMDRALHPALVKRAEPRATATELPAVTKERMLELTAAGEGADDVGDGRLEVRVDDIHGNIASVTVRGGVYREYLQLVRTSEGWKIANSLWAFDDRDPAGRVR